MNSQTYGDLSAKPLAVRLMRETRPAVFRNGVNYFTYLKKSVPALEFGYSQAVIDEELRELDATSLENLPMGLDGSS